MLVCGDSASTQHGAVSDSAHALCVLRRVLMRLKWNLLRKTGNPPSSSGYHPGAADFHELEFQIRTNRQHPDHRCEPVNLKPSGPFVGRGARSRGEESAEGSPGRRNFSLRFGQYQVCSDDKRVFLATGGSRRRSFRFIIQKCAAGRNSF